MPWSKSISAENAARTERQAGTYATAAASRPRLSRTWVMVAAIHSRETVIVVAVVQSMQGALNVRAGSKQSSCPRHLSTTSCNLTPRRCLHARMMRVWASGRLACTQSGLCHMSRHHRMQSPPPHLHKQHMRMMTMMQTKTSIRRFRLHGQSGPQHSTALRGTANVPSTASRLPRSSILQI